MGEPGAGAIGLAAGGCGRDIVPAGLSVGLRSRGPQHEQGERDGNQRDETAHAGSVLLLPLTTSARRFP
jgi:hypothetical protein